MAPSTETMDSATMIDWFENRLINKTMLEKLAQSIQARLDIIGMAWISSGAEVKMLDYACGTGFLSRIFAPHVSSITAIDISATMMEKYNARIDELGTNNETTHAVVGNLLSDPPEPSTLANDEYGDFNLITVGAALHHFPSAENAVKRLAERLGPGGVLYIQDMFDDGHRGSEDKKPRGFTLNEMRSMMNDAGLVEFRFEVLPGELEIEVPSEEVLGFRCFVAWGVKGEQ